MGDGSKCEIVGNGDVIIIIFDDVTRIVMTIRNVLDLRKSLLLLGKIDEDDYNFF